MFSGEWEVVPAQFADEPVLELLAFDDEHFEADGAEVH